MSPATLLLLKPLADELERPAVLRDRPNDVVRRAGGLRDRARLLDERGLRALQIDVKLVSATRQVRVVIVRP